MLEGVQGLCCSLQAPLRVRKHQLCLQKHALLRGSDNGNVTRRTKGTGRAKGNG